MFALCVGMTGCHASANSGFPQKVKDAFGKAQLPLFQEKRAAKDFTLQSIDGKTITLSALKGNVVFLNFWATWCPPCRAEMPSMDGLYRRFKDSGLEMVAVDIMEEQPAVGAFIRKGNFAFPAAIDSDGKVSSAYGIQAVPATFVLDRDGAIILSAVGGRDWNTPEVAAAFETLLENGE
jgi:peroxiredoxin